MNTLHVWGTGSYISLISPECLATAWLLTQCLDSASLEIVTSSNTNFSHTGKLPVLIDHTSKKYQGFEGIYKWVRDFVPIENTDLIVPQGTDCEVFLLERAITSFTLNEIDKIFLYNLYSNSENYEKWTRKQFKKYFPFPMMYNQPSKFYRNAQGAVIEAGLVGSKPGLFTLFNYDSTSHYGGEFDEYEDNNEVALSSLHERHLFTKSKQREKLRESKDQFRNLSLLGDQIKLLKKIHSKRNSTESKIGYILSKHKISSAEILFYAYVCCLTNPELPDKFIYNYLDTTYSDVLQFANKVATTFNSKLYSNGFIIRAPQGDEIPSFINEAKYQVGYITY